MTAAVAVRPWPMREYYTDQRSAVMQRLACASNEFPATNGSQVAELEVAVAERVAAPHCVAVGCATAGLMLSLQAVTANRKGPVGAPAFSFNATVLAAIWNGRRVGCLPSDPKHFNLCSRALEEALRSHEFSALTAIGVGGNLSGIAEVGQLARRFGVPFVLDAAPCLGAELMDKRLTQVADAVVISLSSRKVLPAGEGGLVLTASEKLADAIRRLRVYGSTNGFYCQDRGLNARMSEFHAAVAMGSIDGLDQTLRLRREWAKRLLGRLARFGELVIAQTVAPNVRPAWNDMLLRVPIGDRDKLVAKLQKAGIPAVPFYSPLIYEHPAFRDCCDVFPFQHERATEDLAQSVIGIPILSSLDATHADLVFDLFERQFGSS